MRCRLYAIHNTASVCVTTSQACPCQIVKSGSLELQDWNKMQFFVAIRTHQITLVEF